jgi:hypothetical protein
MTDTLFDCMDCKINTKEIHEYYSVRDEVWLQANPADFGILCIGCLESRLDRPLTGADFSDYPINRIFQKSPRLQAAMNRK